MPEITNISCYCFARLEGLKALRNDLISECRAAGLKGTILLSTEGINVFLAGTREGIDQVVSAIRRVPGLESLAPKFSTTDYQPFSRMIVRIKKEIIAFGVPGIDPASRTSPKLPPEVLRQWLQEGRDFTLLDTRNDYEVKLGTFEGALDLGIGNFRQFPEAVAQLPEDLKDRPLVMFCTGGIRCEKAGPFMESAGFREVYQLDGGILKYFEHCGGDHYHGECFVFDQRVGVDPALQETETTQCFVCQSPLTPSEQNDERHVPGVSCPHCFRSPEDKMRESIARREEKIRLFTNPLPGSQPYENRRPVFVSEEFRGMMLLNFLEKVLPAAREDWEAVLASGRVRDSHGAPCFPHRVVIVGERFWIVQPATTEPEVNANIQILHEDPAIIVVNKPAPLPIHPSGRFNKNTLHHFLAHAYAPENPRPAHRLDASTTGLSVWTRSRHFAKILQPQFAEGNVEKTYLVQTQGYPQLDEFSCDLPISSSPDHLGSRSVDASNGLPALTHFRVLERHPDGSTLLLARPITGRTNQIRVHLWHLGIPACGDPAYLPNRTLGETLTHHPEQPVLRLHCWKIAFSHPATRTPIHFQTPQPQWAHSWDGCEK